MGRRVSDSEKLARLEVLSAAPEEQRAYALSLVEGARSLDVLVPALDVLVAAADPRARAVMLDRYAEYSDGSARDAGAHMRAALLRALRPLARVEDVPLLERAAGTYEFLPPGPFEVAHALRSAALVAINEVDERTAAFYGVRLLVDQHTSKMSGEPALTAVRVLAAQGQLLPLYGYVLREGPLVSEVAGESLRSLTTLPDSLLPSLVDRYLKSEDEIILLGLFDLLMTHPASESYTPRLIDFLRGTRLLTIYRYLVAAMVASAREDWIVALAAIDLDTLNAGKRDVLREALALRHPPRAVGRRRSSPPPASA